MDTALISSKAVDLLSQITGQKLSQRDLTPPVIFLAALITVLLGVIFVDGTVTDEEKQRLQSTLNRFNLSEGDVRQLAKLMLRRVIEQKIYRSINDLLTLTDPLSEPERLLLVAFGYQMSMADGEMDASEKQYLQTLASGLGINRQYLTVLEAGFTHQGTVDPAALVMVHSLLDPAQFHSLDTIFVNATSDILAELPAKPEQQGIQQPRAASYEQLQEFQKYRQQLDSLCYQLLQIIQACQNRDFVPHTLTTEIEKVHLKLKSQRFRVAVVGEFSQGKSTLLNALLGEKIQPVRAVPCSGTVTVLKHGAQKRVVCCYKDGRQENIPFEQYQVKAAMSKEAARDPRSELERSDIDEIIFEHPDLEFCRNGVEIVDSPGLNEHPDRTAVTQKLLKDTDAVIFLANAQRLFPEKEQELLQDLKTQLNGGNQNQPATNLFLVVNFMDMLDEEDDRQDVLGRTESIVKGKNPIVTGENRIHFISAKAALNAILKGTEDEYFKAFQSFTQSVEKFLTLERGSIKIKRSVTELKDLIQASLGALHQSEKVLDDKLNVSNTERQKILEQIAEASGRDVKIRLLAEQLIQQSLEQAVESWKEWAEELGDRIVEKSAYWSSEHSHIWSQDKLIRDYAYQFVQDLSTELDDWTNKKLWDLIVKPNLEVLDRQISDDIEVIRRGFQLFDQRLSTSLVTQFNNIAVAEDLRGIGIGGLSITSSIDSDIGGAGGFLGGLGAGGLVAGALVVFTGVGIIPVILGGLAAAAGGSFGFGLLDVDGIHDQIKQKVFDLGFEKFSESVEEIFGKIDERINSVFNERVEAASGVIEQAISLSEKFFEQQERVHQETLEECEAKNAWIELQRQELGQVFNNMEALVNQYTG